MYNMKKVTGLRKGKMYMKYGIALFDKHKSSNSLLLYPTKREAELNLRSLKSNIYKEIHAAFTNAVDCIENLSAQTVRQPVYSSHINPSFQEDVEIINYKACVSLY